MDQGSWFLQKISELGGFRIENESGNYLICAGDHKWWVANFSLENLMQAYIGLSAGIEAKRLDRESKVDVRWTR